MGASERLPRTPLTIIMHAGAGRCPAILPKMQAGAVAAPAARGDLPDAPEGEEAPQTRPALTPGAGGDYPPADRGPTDTPPRGEHGCSSSRPRSWPTARACR